eukprot:4737506-Prymnesium_polylepis.1
MCIRDSPLARARGWQAGESGRQRGCAGAQHPHRREARRARSGGEPAGGGAREPFARAYPPAHRNHDSHCEHVGQAVKKRLSTD